jgi:hypothetical protein
MRLFGWVIGGDGVPNAARRKWKADWATAVASRDVHAPAALRARLGSEFSSDDDVELEQEMLHGLDGLISLVTNLQQGSLPIVATTHRVVAHEVCHFSAPASLVDVAGSPSGRLLLTRSRAVFVGAGTVTKIPLHAVARVVEHERDVLVGRSDPDGVYRFRFNTYVDALSAAALVRHLTQRDPRNCRAQL